MVLIGCKPKGRNTEQHDIFFGIGKSIKDLVPELLNFWPEADGQIHIDAWREVNQSTGYSIKIHPRSKEDSGTYGPLKTNSLFFINLGGYKEAEFEEFHYKFLIVAPDRAIASQKAKQTAFYKHFGFTGATSHIDDKYGIDIDDIHEIEDILAPQIKAKFTIEAEWTGSIDEDHLNIGYLKLEKISWF